MLLCEHVAMLSLTLRGNQLDAVIGFVSARREGSDVCVLIGRPSPRPSENQDEIGCSCRARGKGSKASPSCYYDTLVV